MPRKSISYLPFKRRFRRRQHVLSPHRSFNPRPTSAVDLCALSNPYGHSRRYSLLSLWFSRIHLPASLPSARLCFPPLSRLSPLRYFRTMETLTSYAAHLQRRSPRLPRHTFLSFRLQPRGLPEHRLPPRQRVQRVSDFAMNEQARRSSPPNRVRSPTDRQFASGCSPPHLTTTQLPSATELWHTPTRTFTVLMWRPHGRTHSRIP